jgi:hypothetical protein
MEIVKFVYNDQEVDFLPNGEENVMVNATQMAKIFGREIKDFNKLESTKNFIDACLNSEDSSLIGIKNKEDLIISKPNSGTWMHRILALKFASWLDPMFDVWIFARIDKIILGRLKEIRDATLEKIEAEKQRDRMQEELLRKYPDEFAAYLELEGKLTAAQKKRVSAIKAASSQMKMNFE